MCAKPHVAVGSVCLAAAVLIIGAAAATSHLRAESAVKSADKPLGTQLELLAKAQEFFPSDEQKVPAARLFRLTRDQLDATAATLLPGYVVKPLKAIMARDPLQTNYEYADLLSVNAANVGALSGWIAGIAARVRDKPAGAIACEGTPPATECLQKAARSFILRAFRGDVPDEKVAQIVAFYTSGVKAVGFAQATSELVEVVLSSPHFLFRKEIDTTRNNRLSPAQLLQAVTYTIADVPPEKLDLKSEQAGQYLTSSRDAGITIDTIVRSQPAREKLTRFFKAWLELKEPTEFTISPEVYPEFNPKLAGAMLDETHRFLAAQLSKANPTLKDITQAQDSYVSKALEGLYATRAADPAGTTPQKLDPAQRLGVFSQPAVLASHSGPTNTRPIKRGVFWARKVMCMELEPPPPELHAKIYELEGATERQKISQSTEKAACIGCHKIINPLGFFQESYDALGKWRTLENGQKIDSSVLIDFLDETPVETATPVEALKTLTNSAVFKQCFVRQVFRFYMGRSEEPSDHPLLRRMYFAFANNDSQDILSLVYTLTSSDRIVRRQ
jgi:Protein of unknown function (DUF1588)/Protein of unknown function (DUF1595)/Protein of unknown function (DUF1592)/Protein of unknown function (DUF1585)